MLSICICLNRQIFVMLAKVFGRRFSTAGSLLTWGQTTYGWGRPHQNRNVYEPDLVQGYPNVTQVSTGPYHIAFVDNSQTVYTAGLGSHGRLGQGTTDSKDSPSAISYFRDAKITVKQVECGDRHTTVLSSSGQVYSWGYGSNLLCNWLSRSTNHYSPQEIQFPEKIQMISSGKDYTFALGESGQVYGVGDGLSTFIIEPKQTPVLIEPINDFVTFKHYAIKKIASVGRATIILFQNGRLYAYGINNGGVFGTRPNPSIITDNSHYEPSKVVDLNFPNERVTDFQMSANSLIFRTDANNVYYSGMFVKYQAQRFPYEVQAEKIFATFDSVGVVDKNGKIYFLNDQFIEDSDKEGKVFVCDDEKLTGNVLQMGGSYRLRYALVA